MVNKKTIRGIVFVVLMLSIVLIAMAAPTVITISPSSISVDVNNVTSFTAKDENSSIITADVNWSSSNTTVGTINSAGQFTALVAGTTTITATNGTVFGTASAIVSAPAATLVLTIITVSPATASLSLGGGVQTFTAAGFDQNGASISISPAAFWSSSNATVGTIDSASGVFTALAEGTTNITATN